MMHNSDSDDSQIRELIGAHFDALKWFPGTNPDGKTFSTDFLPQAQLFPAARPVQARSLDEFIERMNRVAQGSLQDFEERTLGMTIQRFGNVAVVLAASEMLENKEGVNHDVSGYLLVKSEGRWRIAAHAWDKASEDSPVPEQLR
jgi:hypothetical protein